MNIIKIFFSILLSTIVFQPLVAESEKLSLSGSSTLAPLASEIAKLIEEDNPQMRIDVQTGGSSRGIADVRRGLVDIGMSSRKLHPQEEAGVNSHVVAFDGIAFVVHRDNPVSNLTQKEARAIYSGEITNWKQLSGHDASITVIDRAKGRSEKDLITDFLDLPAAKTKMNLVAGENQQCVKLVSGNKNAIVYLSIGTAEYESKNSGLLKLLSLDGIEASSQTVKEKTYPLRRPLLLISKEKQKKSSKTFLKLALSPKVNNLIEKFSFVPTH